MDFVVELIMEILLEGTVEVCVTKSKKVPIVLRFLAGLILGALYGGIFMALFYVGVSNDEPVVIVIALLLLIVSIGFFIKSYRAVRKKRSDKS